MIQHLLVSPLMSTILEKKKTNQSSFLELAKFRFLAHISACVGRIRMTQLTKRRSILHINCSVSDIPISGVAQSRMHRGNNQRIKEISHLFLSIGNVS